MLAILKIMMFNLKVAPTVQWDLTGWQGADTQLNKVQVTATITVTPRGPTRNIFNGAKTKTETFYLNPRTGNQKVDFVYDNYAERWVFTSFLLDCSLPQVWRQSGAGVQCADQVPVTQVHLKHEESTRTA